MIRRRLVLAAPLLGLPVLAFLACSDDGDGPMEPDDGPGPGPLEDRIAFSSDRDGDFEIYLVNMDGTGVEQLTDDPGEDRGPTWSPGFLRLQP